MCVLVNVPQSETGSNQMILAINALILAAGRASRMGVPKVLLPAGRGYTLLSRVLATALASVDGQVIVVLGRNAELCRAEIERYLGNYPQHQPRVVPTENPHYAEGLSTSLRCGVKEVLRLEPASGLMVLLADQLAFDEARARDLIRAFRERHPGTVAVAAAENGEQRNPVVLSADLLPELLKVEGDRGARGVLKRYAQSVQRLELGSGPWFTDTDDWATYVRLMRECGWLEEVSVPEFAGEVPAELIETIEAALKREPRPFLAPEVLLVGVEDGAVQGTMRLKQPALQTSAGQGVKTVIVGNGTSSRAYLDLLRRAALWTLGRSRN